MKSLKYTLSTLLLVLIAVTANAQSLHLSASTNDATVSTFNLGANWEISDNYNIRFLSGYAKAPNNGRSMNAGFGIEHIVPVNIESLNPVLSFDVKGYFAEKTSNRAVAGWRTHGFGVMYSAFTGVKYNKFRLGVSFDQYPAGSQEIMINPSLQFTF